MIEKEPFRNYDLEGKKEDVFSVKLNPEQRNLLDASKIMIEQKKDSTALKQLAWLGAKVILDEKTSYILNIIFKNKLNNKRQNVADFD